jgi:hypothetical protein
MTNLQLGLQRACQELGLDLVVSYILVVRQDTQILTQALLPQLGAPNGMIVVSHYDDLCGLADEIVNANYGYTVLDDPLPTEQFNLEDYKEMFADWGWGARNEQAPDWIA